MGRDLAPVSPGRYAPAHPRRTARSRRSGLRAHGRRERCVDSPGACELAVTGRLLLAVFLASSAVAQINNKGPEAPQGLPAPRTPDGHIDFTGVYYGPGYGPSDPPIRGGDTIARNITRGMKPEDVPLLPSAVELMRQRAETNSKDD